MKKMIMGAVQRKEVILIAVLAAFLISYYFISAQRTDEYSVDGLKIYSSEQPRQALARVLSKDSFLMEEQLFNGMDERNTAIAIIGAEVVSALKAHGKSVATYGSVEGTPSINCNANTSNCTGASIIVGIGECNCMRVGDKIEIYGTSKFLQDNAVKIRGILRLVLNDVAPTPVPVATVSLPSSTPTPIPSPIMECSRDSECAAGGTYGVVCGIKELVENLTTAGDWRPEYRCFEKQENLTSCRCTSGLCKWERTPEFCDCAKSFNTTFSGCESVGANQSAAPSNRS